MAEAELLERDNRRRYQTRLRVRRHRDNARSSAEYIANIAAARERRRSESETARQHRLSQLRSRAAQRRNDESGSQREERLSHLRDAAAVRRSDETGSQREERLSHLRDAAAVRRSDETGSQREERLSHLRDAAAVRRSDETGSQREERLSHLRDAAAVRRSDETGSQREERLLNMRSRATERRNGAAQADRYNYLHEEGWKDHHPHHDQPWVQSEMRSFRDYVSKWENRLCVVCHEVWPTQCTKGPPEAYTCTRCKRDKHVPNLFSFSNDMNPGEVPQCLQGLSQVEQMLIARVNPIMCLYRKHGGQRGYRGHVLNVAQDVQSFLDKLPANISDLPILLVRRNGCNNTHIDLRVRRDTVLTAIQWLQQHNPFYADVTINFTNLNSLPQDDIPDQLLSLEDRAPDTQEGDSATDIMASSTSFLPLPSRGATEDEAIRSTINGIDPLEWPTIGDNPISEFKTAGLASMAFPTLFPHGKGDPTCPSRRHAITLTEAFKHLIHYADVVDGKYYWRFASHPRFPYWALNMKMRHQLLSQSNVYMQQHPTDAELTVEDLQDMISRGIDAQQLMNRLQRYAGKVQGSAQFWYQKHQELRALLDQKGPPTIFWTVSSADMHWPELHDLLPHQHAREPTIGERVQAVIANPHLTDWFFCSRLKKWVSSWLYQSLDAEWHWYRIEYQSRGSTHAHGCAKLKNDPGLCNLVRKAALGWEASQADGGNSIDPQQLQQVIQEGNEAKAAVLQYCDWLVTTDNNDIPGAGDPSHPPKHPCSLRHSEIEDHNGDYHDLVNAVERHTRCSAAYCLRSKQGQLAECRFKYPRPTQEESTLTFERLSDGSIRGTLTTRRNDPRINSHSRTLLQNWRANVDVQVIVDPDECARYMAKYAAKGESKSTSMTDILKSCVDSSVSTPSALRRAMVRAIGERDFSSQETGHMLMSLPLMSCSFTFIAISLTGDRRISEIDSQLKIQPSILDDYANRTELMDINLIQFVSEYSNVRGQLQKRSAPVIVRTFPNYSPNPEGENYGLHCKFQLIKYRPWNGSTSAAWSSLDSTPEVWIEQYHQFLLTDLASQLLPSFSQELHYAEQRVSHEIDSDDESSDDPHEQDEWMLLCQLNPMFTSLSHDTHEDFDWSASTRDLPPDLIGECPTWISSQRSLSSSNSNSPWQRVLPVVDSASLNSKQKLAYNILQQHYHSLTSGNDPEPLHMIISGTAGTGKSYLISALASLLGESSLLTATTGMASFHICGLTIHSAIKLPIHKSNQRDLQGSSLQRLQISLTGKHYVIIDEMSMIGLKMFAWIDKRLRQASGRLDLPFGGFSILMIGDYGQLPPVGDKPLYAPPSANDLSIHGHHIYQLFNAVVILDQVIRQQGTDPEAQNFRDLLLRLRNGETTEADWELLLQRAPHNVSNSQDFNDAVHIYYDKKSVANHNMQKLQALNKPIARINAVHSNRIAAGCKSDDAGGLHSTLLLSEGASVMLTANLWAQTGLCNGAPGTVFKILYQDGQHPPSLPIAVIVQFQDYSGPAFIPGIPTAVPIPPVTFEWSHGCQNLSRQQLPLQLSFSITIHKSQGQTLQKAVIDLGSRELSPGSTFVAISRLPSLKCAIIQPMPFERLTRISASRNFAFRREEDERLKDIAQGTCDHYQL